MKKTWSILILALILISFGGCAKRTADNTGYQVYFTNAGRTYLVTESYHPKETETELLLGEILARMMTPAQGQENYSLIPEGVEILEYDLTDGQFTVTFSENYHQLESVSEILLRAGVVRSVSQVPDVRTVVFHIGDDVLRDSIGEPVGAMTSSMFINNPVGINSYQYASLTLYYANQEGDRIVKEMRNVHYSSNTTLEKVVMEQLCVGPMNKQLKAVLPEELKILGITVDKKTCTVNLDKTILDNPVVGVTPEVTIYSMVNSLCDVLNVEKVEFRVEGEADILYGGLLSFNGPFHRNSDIIETRDTIDTSDTDEEDEGVIAEPFIGL